MRKVGLCLLILVLAVSSQNPSEKKVDAGMVRREIFSNFNAKILVNYDHIQNAPIYHGGYLSWMDTRLNDNEGKIMPRIYMKDIAKGEEKATPSYAKKSGSRTQYRNRIAWAENSDRLKRPDNFDVKVFDFKKGTTDTICKDKSRQDNPQISENFIIWRDWRDSAQGGGVWDFAVYGIGADLKEEFLVKPNSVLGTAELFDNYIALSTKSARGDFDVSIFNCVLRKNIPICTELGDQICPKIAGDVVLWMDNKNSTTQGDNKKTDIFGYSLQNKQNITISSKVVRQYGLTTDGVRYAVWFEDSEGTIKGALKPIIRGYDTFSGKIFTVNDVPGIYANPVVDGHYVIYEDSSDEAFGVDLKAYDIASGKTWCLAKGFGDQRNPKIYSDYVVWEDIFNPEAEQVSIWGASLAELNESKKEPFWGYDVRQIWNTFRGDTRNSGKTRTSLKPFDKYPMTLQWQVDFKDPIFSSVCFSKKGNAFVGCDDGYMYKISAVDGSILWRFKAMSKIRSSPVLYRDRLFFGDQSGAFYCINAETGIQIWQIQTSGAIEGSPLAFTSDVDHYGCVVFASGDKKLYMYSALANTPVLRWSLELGGWSYSKPCVDYNWLIRTCDNEPVQKVIYIGASNNRLICIQASTGMILSEFAVESSIESSPSCVGTKVIFGSKDGNFYGIDFNLFAFRPYVFFKQSTNHILVSSPIFDPGQDRFYFEGKAGALFSFKNDTEWAIQLDTSMRSSPALVDDGDRSVIVAGSDSGILNLIDKKTGKSIWNAKLTGAVSASPSIYNTGFFCVIVGTTDSRLHCFGQRPKMEDD